jgi:multiple sugar transport system substrate-binding protein
MSRSFTRRRIMALCASAATAGMAACQRQTTPAGSAQAPQPAAGPLKLSLSAYASGATVKPYETIKARFESQHPQSEIELMLFPAALGQDSLAEKIVAMTAAGTPPDVFLTIAQLKPQWARQGMLLDLSDRVKKSSAVRPSMYYKPVVDAMMYQGKFYGTPWGYNSMVMYLNLDLFAEKGLPVPSLGWTYDDFAELARMLTDTNRGIFGTRNHANGSTNPVFALMYNHAGHYWVDETETRALVDSPDAVAMYEYWLRLQNVLKVTDSPQQPLPQGKSQLDGIVGMWMSWSTEPFSILQKVREGVVYRWKMHTWPKGPKAQTHFAQGHLWSIAQNHRAPDKAWILAEWMGSMEAEKVWAEEHRTPPQVPDEKLWQTYFDQLPPAEQKEAIDFIVNRLYRDGYARDFQYWPTYDQCRVVMEEEVRAIFVTGAKSPKQAMSDAAQRINAILARNR